MDANAEDIHQLTLLVGQQALQNLTLQRHIRELQARVNELEEQLNPTVTESVNGLHVVTEQPSEA